MKHYIYQITNKLNNKFYRGVHSTDNLDDGYMGSGLNISRAIKKYGVENFLKEILCFCDTRSDAFELEELAVQECDISNPLCYNINVGGNMPPKLIGDKNPNFGGLSSEHKQKLKASRREYIQTLSTEEKKALPGTYKKGRTPNNKGKTYSCRATEAIRLRTIKLTGEGNGNAKYTDEQIKEWILQVDPTNTMSDSRIWGRIGRRFHVYPNQRRIKELRK